MFERKKGIDDMVIAATPSIVAKVGIALPPPPFPSCQGKCIGKSNLPTLQTQFLTTALATPNTGRHPLSSYACRNNPRRPFCNSNDRLHVSAGRKSSKRRIFLPKRKRLSNEVSSRFKIVGQMSTESRNWIWFQHFDTHSDQRDNAILFNTCTLSKNPHDTLQW